MVSAATLFEDSLVCRDFTAADFTGTKYWSAEDKARFANHFRKFVERGFPRELFHRWFYSQLMNTFGHIAHYDENGFYATFFTTPADISMFFRYTLEYGCYNPDHRDVERAIQNWLVESGLIQAHIKRRDALEYRELLSRVGADLDRIAPDDREKLFAQYR